MDYTLAQYKPETFEGLAHEQTIIKMVQGFGYPPSLYDLKFDWRYMMRGLVIDKVRLLSICMLHVLPNRPASWKLVDTMDVTLCTL